MRRARISAVSTCEHRYRVWGPGSMVRAVQGSVAFSAWAQRQDHSKQSGQRLDRKQGLKSEFGGRPCGKGQGACGDSEVTDSPGEVGIIEKWVWAVRGSQTCAAITSITQPHQMEG